MVSGRMVMPSMQGRHQVQLLYSCGSAWICQTFACHLLRTAEELAGFTKRTHGCIRRGLSILKKLLQSPLTVQPKAFVLELLPRTLMNLRIYVHPKPFES